MNIYRSISKLGLSRHERLQDASYQSEVSFSAKHPMRNEIENRRRPLIMTFVAQ
jgi:hypothetical protein